MKVIENGILREMTAKEIAEYEASIKLSTEEQIEMLKQNLSDTDYKAIKYAEGLISDEEYAETKKLRQQWRKEINQLENELTK